MLREASLDQRAGKSDLFSFDWADPLRLGDELTVDERMVSETARSYS